MTLTTSRSLTRLLPVLLIAVAVSATLVDARAQFGRARTAPADTYTKADALFVVQRLYRATLAREGDARGVELAVAELERGNLQKLIDSQVTSQEFLRTTNRLEAPAILEQFYRGLLNRGVDPAGTGAFLQRIRQRQYTSVLLEMVRSPEFRATYGAAPLPGVATPVPTAATTKLDAALDCQSRVIDAVRAQAPGLVFLSFDHRLPDTSADNRVVSGPAVDRFDADRRLNYRCDGSAVSFNYEDGGSARGADTRLEFPSAAVRNCQAAALGGRSVTQDGAALSKSDTSTEYVLGVAIDRDNGQAVRFTCEMDVLRVVNVRMR